MPFEGKTLFVTVGTTQFDELIEKVVSSEVIQLLRSLGFVKLLLQIGTGAKPDFGNVVGMHIEHYDLKECIARDINEASLVISHAGSGSILQVLRASKKLIVVVNDALLDNHQTELASQLHEDGHLLCSSVSNLCDVLKLVENTEFKPFPEPNLHKFPNILDHIVGFAQN